MPRRRPGAQSRGDHRPRTAWRRRTTGARSRSGALAPQRPGREWETSREAHGPDERPQPGSAPPRTRPAPRRRRTRGDRTHDGRLRDNRPGGLRRRQDRRAGVAAVGVRIASIFAAASRCSSRGGNRRFWTDGPAATAGRGRRRAPWGKLRGACRTTRPRRRAAEPAPGRSSGLLRRPASCRGCTLRPRSTGVLTTAAVRSTASPVSATGPRSGGDIAGVS